MIKTLVQKQLFSSIPSALLSVVILSVLVIAGWYTLDWAILGAKFLGSDRSACDGISGACWVFVVERIKQFCFGFYPEAKIYRPVIFLLFLLINFAWLFSFRLRKKIFPIICLYGIAPILVYGWLYGAFLPTAGALSQVVPTEKWGGLFLTIVIAFFGIVYSFPLGILLALGRRSSLPLVRWFCTAFIELWRGIPLITVLFMASVLLPLFVPANIEVNKLFRALLGIALFSSAYMAEVIRGGLQAIDSGQYEASDSLGFSYGQKYLFIILPQAIRVCIPGIVNTVIGLFKDTSLVLIIGMFDLLGIVQTASTDPDWLGFHVEGYVFCALVYFGFCYSMSLYSLKLEKKWQF